MYMIGLYDEMSRNWIFFVQSSFDNIYKLHILFAIQMDWAVRGCLAPACPPLFCSWKTSGPWQCCPASPPRPRCPRARSPPSARGCWAGSCPCCSRSSGSRWTWSCRGYRQPPGAAPVRRNSDYCGWDTPRSCSSWCWPRSRSRCRPPWWRSPCTPASWLWSRAR